MSKKIYLVFSLLLTSFFQSFSQGDNCYDATVISSPGSFCYTGDFTNKTATQMPTASGTMAPESCWSTGNNYDVWFTFTAVGTKLSVTVDGMKSSGYSYIYGPGIALLDGTCTGSSSSYNANFSPLTCIEGSSYSSNATLNANNLIKGHTYFIRISSQSGDRGDFGMCLINSDPAPTGSEDCTGAVKLCSEKSTPSVSAITSFGTKQETSTLALNGVKMTEHQTIWYQFIAGKAGNLTFNIKPKTTANDIDFGLYQSSTANACGTLTPLRINTSSCWVGDGSTGLNMTSTDQTEASGCAGTSDEFLQYVTLVPGTTYVLVIDNASPSASDGFDLTFGGTATFSPDSLFTISPNDYNICTGDAVTFTPSTSVGNFTYAWKFDNTGSSQTVTGSGAQSRTFATKGIYTETLSVTNTFNCTNSSSQKIYVVDKPQINITPSITSICPGNSLNLVGSVTTSGTISTGSGSSTANNNINTMSWSPTTGLSNTNNIGVGSQSGSATTTTSTANTYTLTAKDDAGCISTKSVTVSVTGPPAPTCANAAVCSGTSTTLTASGNTGANYTWYSAATGGTVLATTASYNTPAISVATSYWVTQTSGGCESTRTKVDVSLKTTEAPSISCGTSTTNSVDFNWAANTGATSYTLSYNPGTGIITSSQAGLTKTISGLSMGQTIALTVTPVGTGCYTPATFSCTANNCPSPTITTQPVNSTKCAGTATSFSVVQTGGSTFKWQISTNGGTSYTDVVANGIYSGVTSTTLSISDVTGLTGNKYQVVISPATGTCILTSTAALLTVNPLPTATLSGNVSQCENVSSPIVTFTGANGTTPYTFTYTKSGVGGNTLSTTSGNSTTITIPSTPSSNNTFSINSISDNNGCTQAVTGQSNTVTIKPIETPTLTCGTSTTSSASFNWTACTGVTDYSISYNSGSGAQTAANQTSLSYTLSGLPGGGSGSITVTPNGTGCYTAATLSCTANNCPSPTIDTHPSSSIKCAGTSTSFTIAQTGGSTIQWMVSTNNGVSYTNISPSTIYSGETGLTLTISDVTGLNGNMYKAKVIESGGICSITSNSALLTVNVLPTATLTGTTAICKGKSTNLNVALTGIAPWNYSYSDGTTTISKTAVASSPSIIAVSPAATTTYNLVSVSDANCTGTINGSAVITINEIPVISAILDTTLCHKTNKPTTVFTSTPTGATFNWTNTDASIGLASVGVGDIAKFEVQNLTSSPITNTIEVTPTLAGCVGSPIQFHLTINPFLTTKITATDSTMNSISFAWNAVNGATSYDVSTALNPVNAATTFTSVTLPNPLATTYTHGGLKMGDKVQLKVTPKGATGTCYLPATLIAMTDSCKKATILTQPKSASKCISETVSFSFVAKGNDSISGIKWQESKDGTNWTDLVNSGVYSGVKTSGLFINNLAGLNGNKYRASILGTINSCEIFTNVVDLNVFPIPTPNFIVDKTTGCAPLTVRFTNQSGYNDATITWDFGDGATLTKKVDADLDELHTFQIPDSFNVSLIVNRNGCVDTVQTKITVMTPSIAKFKMDKNNTSLLDPTLALTNLSSNNSVVYKWTFDDNSPISNLKNPNHTFDPIAGDYKIILYTSSINSFSDTSCISKYEQKFTILDDVIYYIPNTFTPNGDEVNNTFQPVFFSGFDPQHYYFSIYNRWGEIIFESFNPSYGWDGTYGNKIIESATYVWKLQFKEKQNDKEHYLTGHLNLIK